MDPSFVPAISALLGTLVGGLASFATSYVSLNVQARQARLTAERVKREELYGGFMSELAVLFADALARTDMDYFKLANAFGLKGRIHLLASPPVLECADASLKFIMDLALGPPRTGEDVRRMMDDKNVDPIGSFATACRAEMVALGLG